MRIFYTFLIVFAVSVLFMLPITEGVYDFRTDLGQDSFRHETGVGETTANVTLIREVYDADLSTMSCTSTESDDNPVVEGYHTGTRVTDVSGLIASTNRTLVVSYDYDALGASDAIDVFIDRIAWVWLLCVIVFAPAALASLWLNRAR